MPKVEGGDRELIRYPNAHRADLAEYRELSEVSETRAVQKFPTWNGVELKNLLFRSSLGDMGEIQYVSAQFTRKHERVRMSTS